MIMQYPVIVALTCMTMLTTTQASERPERPKDQKQYQKIQQKNITTQTLAQNPQLETYFNESQCLSCHSINQLQGLFIEAKRKQ